MTRSIYQRAAATGLAAMLALLVPAAALAETTPAKPIPVPGAAGGSTAAPAPALSKEEAIALVKRYFAIPDGPGKLNANLDTFGGRMLWQLMYEVRQENGSTGYGIGQVDARTGQILQVSLNPMELRPIRTGPLGTPKPESAAREKAWALVKELFPERVDSLRPAPAGASQTLIYFGSGPSSDTYTFIWNEYINEVPLTASSVSVSVDKYSLEIVDLSSNFQTVKLPAAGQPIAPEEALKLFRANMAPKLSYQPIWSSVPNARGPGAMKLVYQMAGGGFVDAVSGKFVDSTGREVRALSQPEALPASSEPAVKPDKLPLTAESALVFATAALKMPEAGQVDTGRYPNQGSVANIYWNEPGRSMSLSVETETGLILNAYRSEAQQPMPYDAEPLRPEVTPAQREQAKQAAIKLVQRFYSQLLGDLKLQPQPDPIYGGPYSRVSLFFQRFVNGIPAGYDGVRVNIDPATGEWTDFGATWSKAQFPQVTATVDPQQVEDAFFAVQEPVLSYQVKVDPRREPYRRFAPQAPQDAMLVYQLSNPAPGPSLALVDAVSGKPVVLPGQAAALQESVEKVLAGHWAEGELRFMLASGALKPEELDVGRSLTRAQLLQMMITALQRSGRYGGGSDEQLPFTDVKQDDPLYYLVQQGYYLGFLKPEGEQPAFGGDKPATRAEFVLWATRVLGLDRLARTGLKTESGFTDLDTLTAEQQNAIAFLEALGILKPEKRFRGSDPIWQGEGAALVVRLIQYLRSAR
jgi:hypothetical protein